MDFHMITFTGIVFSIPADHISPSAFCPVDRSGYKALVRIGCNFQKHIVLKIC